MSTQTVTCPHCQTLLRSDRPLRAGISLRCPDCKTSFSAPDPAGVTAKPLPPLPPPVSAPGPHQSLIAAPLIIAVTVSLLLGGAMIAGAIIISTPRTPVKTADQVDPVAEERRKLEEERKKLAEDRARLASEAVKQKYDGLMKQAQIALGKNLFADAEKGFEEALKLLPGDAEALKGLKEASGGLLAAAKTSEIDAKNKAEVDRLLVEAGKAMTDKQYAAAVRVLSAAQKISPANRAVVDALLEAQKALDADSTEKKKLADYKKFMDLGKAAMVAERYPDAVKAYIDALALMPDDLEAQDGRKQAERKILAMGDKTKQQKAFEDLLERARQSQNAKRFNDAIAQLNAALRINKGDAEADRLLRAAQKALKDAKAENAKLLAQANTAVGLGQLAAAKKLCEDAIKNWAEDADAEKALKNVDRLQTSADTTLASYKQAVQNGVLAMAAARYADAVAAYAQAVALNPTDVDSALALKRAQAALAIELKAAVTYAQLIKVGNNALASGAARTAIQAFRDALKITPGDPVAADGLAQARSLDRYNQAMTAGKQALAAKQKQAAIRAFNAALTEKPGDTQASNGLRQAQLLR